MLAFYDLNKSPATYDFTHWLANVEFIRKNENDPSLQVGFILGDRQKTERDISFSAERKLWRLHNLLVPLCRAVPSVNGYAVGCGGKQTIGYAPIQPIARKCFDAPPDAKIVAKTWQKGKYVTISIRRMDFQEYRNSNLDEWRRVAKWLQAHSYYVVIVPETEDCLSGAVSMPEFDQCWPAAINPMVRLALYQGAAMNYFVCGGPFSLALYSASPFYMCKLFHPKYEAVKPETHKRLGLYPGAPLHPGQIISDSVDTADAIISETRQFLQEAA